MSHVVATAGHVDHGKSTLVRALTGIEPDRWEEEHRRGLTIDLGFAWTRLPGGREVAFVDVPGHQRFIANMLAGLGPAPVVCLVVAADGGWSAQSGEHRDAITALGIEHGLVVVTRSDLAPDRVDEVSARARHELAGTGLRDAPVVAVSARTGAGLDELRSALDGVLSRVPAPDPGAPLRLWVDRSFSIRGAGTVVTGTLAAGSLRVGDALVIGGRTVTVRGLQRHEQPVDAAGPVSRVAVNLRGVAADEVSRGDVLVTPGTWHETDVVDVRAGTDTLAPEVTVHVGTADVPGRLRPLGPDHARVTLSRALPLLRGDRLVLRHPGSHAIVGALVLDVEPPSLSRRGDAARRATHLAAGDLAHEVARRGLVRPAHLARLGWAVDEAPSGVRELGGWWVDEQRFGAWVDLLPQAVRRHHADQPLSPGLSVGAAASLLDLPDADLVGPVAAAAGLVTDGEHVAGPGHDAVSGIEGLARLEARLAEAPFSAPEAHDLVALGLGPRELAAAERAGRLLRLGDGIVVLPQAPPLAMRALSALEQPFTTSQARQALATTRRVAIPLLEHLDRRGWTRRLDGTLREVVGP